MIEFRKLAIDFRHKWLTQIQNDKVNVLPFEMNGMRRQIFLISNSTSWINQFVAERNKLEKELQFPINGPRSPISWLPQIIQSCHHIRVKAYPAVSSRKISKVQAREFAKKAGVMLPAGGEHFRLRTNTGTKLMLAACVESSSKLVTKYVPFSEWCVVEMAPNVPSDSFSSQVDNSKKTKLQVFEEDAKTDQTDSPIASFGRSLLYLRQPTYQEVIELYPGKIRTENFDLSLDFDVSEWNQERNGTNDPGWPVFMETSTPRRKT